MLTTPKKTKRKRQPPARATPALPPQIADWFARRGWKPRAHQLALLEAAQQHRSTLLIAPTGAGKTLAGFLPSLIALGSGKRQKKGAGLYTLYVSPLKALATDVARNLIEPIEEMGLNIHTETRTGDTSIARRQRQRIKPPQILLTTPEQVALLLVTPTRHTFLLISTPSSSTNCMRLHRQNVAIFSRSTSRGYKPLHRTP